MVSPQRHSSPGSFAITGLTASMRTAVRNWRSSRATATQTPRTTTLKQHQITFIVTVPRRSAFQMKKRGIAISSPRTLNTSMTRNGCAILESKNVRLTTPSLDVTLNLPSFGLMSANTVGSRMYGERAGGESLARPMVSSDTCGPAAARGVEAACGIVAAAGVCGRSVSHAGGSGRSRVSRSRVSGALQGVRIVSEAMSSRIGAGWGASDAGGGAG